MLAVPGSASGRQRARTSGSVEVLAVLERVEQLPRDRVGVLLTGALAGIQDASALVHEVAQLEDLLLRQPRGVARTPARFAGHGVVAGVPEDRVVVAQDAEVVRRGPPVGVDVVHVEWDAVGGEGIGVEDKGEFGPLWSAYTGEAPV